MAFMSPQQQCFFINNDENDDETFWNIVDETKTKTKIMTRDENEIEINGI